VIEGGAMSFSAAQRKIAGAPRTECSAEGRPVMKHTLESSIRLPPIFLLAERGLTDNYAVHQVCSCLHRRCPSATNPGNLSTSPQRILGTRRRFRCTFRERVCRFLPTPPLMSPPHVPSSRIPLRNLPYLRPLCPPLSPGSQKAATGLCSVALGAGGRPAALANIE